MHFSIDCGFQMMFSYLRFKTKCLHFMLHFTFIFSTIFYKDIKMTADSIFLSSGLHFTICNNFARNLLPLRRRIRDREGKREEGERERANTPHRVCRVPVRVTRVRESCMVEVQDAIRLHLTHFQICLHLHRRVGKHLRRRLFAIHSHRDVVRNRPHLEEGIGEQAAMGEPSERARAAAGRRTGE